MPYIPPELLPSTTNDVEVLQEQFTRIEARLEELQVLIPQRAGDEQRELKQEQTEMLRALRHLMDKLHPPMLSPEEKVRQANAALRTATIVEAAVRERLENLDSVVARFEADGDHRNARLYRQQKLTAREDILREYGVQK